MAERAGRRCAGRLVRAAARLADIPAVLGGSTRAALLRRYLLTLSAGVLAASCAFSFLPFVSQTAVVAGASHLELRRFELGYAAGNHYQTITAEQARFLTKHSALRAAGSAHLLAGSVLVTPAIVSVHTLRSHHWQHGAVLEAMLAWDTPPGLPEGAEGRIYLDVPPFVPGLEFTRLFLISGAYQPQGDRYVVREERAYRQPLRLALARATLALSIGLPFGVLLHAVWWFFGVLRPERASRIAALPWQLRHAEQGRTFHPDPIAEWRAALYTLGGFALAGGGLAWGSTRVASDALTDCGFLLTAVGAMAAVAVAARTRRRVLSLRVEPQGLFVARGRGELQWRCIPWDQITGIRQGRSRYGPAWMKLTIRGRWLKLKLTDVSVVDFPDLLQRLQRGWRKP